MKIETSENSVTLIPESKWEEQALKQIKNRGVISIQFKDAWEQTGGLVLEHRSNDDWGR